MVSPLARAQRRRLPISGGIRDTIHGQGRDSERGLKRGDLHETTRTAGADAWRCIVACSGGSASLQPGQWEMTTKMTDIEMPGAPPAMAAQMKQAMAAQAQTQTRCITPQEAANPAGGMMSPSGNAQGCTFTKQTFSGGTIDVAGSCPAPAGGTCGDQPDRHLYRDHDGRADHRRTSTGGPAARCGCPARMTGRRTGDCPG